MPPPNSPEGHTAQPVNVPLDHVDFDFPSETRPTTPLMFDLTEPAPSPTSLYQPDDIWSTVSAADLDEMVPRSWTVDGRQLTPYMPPLNEAYLTKPVPSNTVSRRRTEEHNPNTPLVFIHRIDFTAVVYEDDVDENLLCAICKVPLVDPVMTRCHHIFCRACLVSALKEKTSCPIDRSNLDFKIPFVPAPSLVRNLVDSLKVTCPLCKEATARSSLEDHLTKACPEALMACPGSIGRKRCVHPILRKRLTEQCQHYLTDCPSCHLTCLAIDMDRHYNEQCTERFTTCKHCGSQCLQHKPSLHESECLEVDVPCKWESIGCTHVAKRKNMQIHEETCEKTKMGEKMLNMETMMAKIHADRAALFKEQDEQSQRIGTLETTIRNFKIPFEEMEGAPVENDSMVLNTSFEHIMALMDNQQQTINRLTASIDQMEARNATLIYNETLPIRTDLGELRSMQQTTSMHVRWLMNFKIQENRRVRAVSNAGIGVAGGSGAGGESSDAGGSGTATLGLGRTASGRPVPRRSSANSDSATYPFHTLHEPRL